MTMKSLLVLVGAIGLSILLMSQIGQATDMTGFSHFDRDSPHDLAVFNVSYTYIWLQWSPPQDNTSDINNYFVESKIHQNGYDKKIHQVPANQTHFMVVGLLPGTRYSFFVSANYSTGHHPHSYSLTKMTNGFGGIDRPCNCSKLGTNQQHECSENDGICKCKSKHFFGARCDKCYPGWYMHNKIGCQRCDCPTDRSDSTCFISELGLVSCGCKKYFAGPKCEVCANGYYMYGGKCAVCRCYGNANMSSPEICDKSSGKCTACMYNTAGNHCERCARQFEGDALRRNCSRIIIKPPIAYYLGMSKTSNIVIVVIAAVCFTILLIIGVIFLYRHWKQVHNNSLWTIRLQDDRENVNFSHLESVDSKSTDDSLVSPDDVQYFAKDKPMLAFTSGGRGGFRALRT